MCTGCVRLDILKVMRYRGYTFLAFEYACPLSAECYKSCRHEVNVRIFANPVLKMVSTTRVLQAD